MATFKPPHPEVADLSLRFEHHAPDPETAERHELVRALFESEAIVLCSIVPPGREKSLMITKLEEAMMWANAAIARDPETPPTLSSDDPSVAGRLSYLELVDPGGQP